MTKKSRPLSSSFAATSFLRDKVRNGIAAVASADRSLLHDEVKNRISESLDLDTELQATYPTQHRWDYLVGDSLTASVVAIEPHTAGTGEVGEVIAKKRAAVNQLSGHLNASARVRKWIWVSSGPVQIFPLDKVGFRLDQAGITLAGRIVLPKHLK